VALKGGGFWTQMMSPLVSSASAKDSVPVSGSTMVGLISSNRSSSCGGGLVVWRRAVSKKKAQGPVVVGRGERGGGHLVGRKAEELVEMGNDGADLVGDLDELVAHETQELHLRVVVLEEYDGVVVPVGRK